MPVGIVLNNSEVSYGTQYTVATYKVDWADIDSVPLKPLRIARWKFMAKGAYHLYQSSSDWLFFLIKALLLPPFDKHQ